MLLSTAVIPGLKDETWGTRFPSPPMETAGHFAAVRMTARPDLAQTKRSPIKMHPTFGILDSKKVEKKMPTEIHFGTSGWRAIVADEFTLPNIRRAIIGIAKYVSKQPGKHRILVGRDPRFMGEMFVEEAARLLAEGGVVPEVIGEAAPTPAISYAVRQRKTSGAINFTASHNPPEYNGIKFSTPDGAPALPEVTKQIEAEIAGLGDAEIPAGTAKEKFENVDVKPDYLKRLAELIDIKAIAKAKLRIVVDPFWGAGRGYAQQLLTENGVSAVSVHDYRDVLFGGHAPEPDDALLGDCRAKDARDRCASWDCLRRRCGSIWNRRSRRNLYPAELHYCAAVRLPGGDAGLAKWRGQERGHDKLHQRAGGALQDSSCTKRRWDSSTLAS